MPIDKTPLIEAYMHHVLEQGVPPKNVFVFMKDLEKDEADFYAHFASFEALEACIFESFFDNAMALLSKDEGFVQASPQDKLLSLYFTLFEVFLGNRSYVVYALGDALEMPKALSPFGFGDGLAKALVKLPILKLLRKRFKGFIDELDLVDESFTAQIKAMERINEWKGYAVRDVAWWQFVGVLGFWIKDTSPQFEKTDVLIEKIITTSLAVVNTSPLEKIVDLGKFLYKEAKA